MMNHVHSGYGPHLSPLLLLALAVLVIWTIAWKGFALWYAARNNQKIWFFFLLIVNLFGILEIIYLAFFRKNKNVMAVGSSSLAQASKPE